MTIFAGIDGGQSGSRAVLADEQGTILARVSSAPLYRAGGDARDIAMRLQTILRKARSAGGESRDDTIEALVAGVSGQDEAAHVPCEPLGARRARLVHDSEIAQAGALAGYHGIVVVAGSGSVGFGTGALGRRVRHGGWGATFGDDGSAIWIGRRAVSAAMRAADASVPTRLGTTACAFFRAATLRGLAHASLRGEVSLQQLGEFAPTVLAIAHDGDAVAQEVLNDASAALVELTVGVDRALEPQPGRAVSWAGKVFDSVALRDSWRAAVTAALDRPRIFPPRAEPVIGALLLAFRDAGREPPAALLRASE